MNLFQRIRGAQVAALLIASATSALTAQNYIIVDNQTGYILAGKGENEKRQIASLTKVATALVVLDWAQLQKADLSQMVSIAGQDLRGSSINPAGLQEGDSVSLRDLLYCALMASDNIASNALARHVGARLPNARSLDPVGNFVSHMNALARTLGMKRTLFLNPSGLDAGIEGTLPHSTAADMARLTRYAYSEADFPFFVSQKSRVVHVFRAGQDLPVSLKNTNELLGQNDIDGVKTGRTSRAGDCFILSSEKKPEVTRQGETVYVTPRRLIVVLLGSRDRATDGRVLTGRGWNLYEQWAAGGRKAPSNKAL